MIRRQGEKSFSLFETIIALSLIVTVILEMVSLQGKSITLDIYSRKMTKAMWLAKSVLSRVEYLAKFHPLKELNFRKKAEKFDDFLCSKEEGCPFKYNIEVKDWKLPLIDLILGGSGMGRGDAQSNPMTGMIKAQVEKHLGKELLKVAIVEVFWDDGARLGSVKVPYLLTSQLAVDKIIETLPSPKGSSKDDKGKEGVKDKKDADEKEEEDNDEDEKDEK